MYNGHERRPLRRAATIAIVMFSLEVFMALMNSEGKLARERYLEAGEFPKVVLIDTVSFCNLRCSMCFHRDMKRQRGFMSWGTFKKIIDEISLEDKNVRVWMAFFGEALIARKNPPTIFDLIRYAKEQGLSDVVMNSNANLLDENSARSLIHSGLDGIYIGIDAATRETYEKLRVGGNFDVTVQNVNRLLELKMEMGATKPQVFTQFVEMDANHGEKEGFIGYWSERGAIVKIRPKVSWAGKIEAPNLKLGNENRLPCHWAMQTLSITDTGKVVLCAVDLDGQYVAGDIHTQTIKEIWNGPLKEIRKKHLEHDFHGLPEFCENCRDWQSAFADYHERK